MNRVSSLSGTPSSCDFRLEMSNRNREGLTTTQYGREVIHVRISQIRGIPGKCPGAKGVIECDYTVHAITMLEKICEHMALFAPGTQ